MGKVLLLVDNSNIFIAVMKLYGERSRFSYKNFENLCAGSDVIIEKHLVGSTPPSNDGFWAKMRYDGYKVHTYERVSAGYGHTKEKGVDTSLALNGAVAIERHKPDRVVLMSGDRDFVSIAGLRDQNKEEQGHSFVLDVWAFSDSLSPELERVCDNVFKMEDYKEETIFYQYEDGTTESFVVKEEREAFEKKQRAERIAFEAKQRAESLAIEKENKKRQDDIKRKKSEDTWGTVAVSVFGTIFLGALGYIVKGKFWKK